MKLVHLDLDVKYAQDLECGISVMLRSNLCTKSGQKEFSPRTFHHSLRATLDPPSPSLSQCTAESLPHNMKSTQDRGEKAKFRSIHEWKADANPKQTHYGIAGPRVWDFNHNKKREVLCWFLVSCFSGAKIKMVWRYQWIYK